MSAKTAGYSTHHHKLGPGPLWGKPGFQLPAYISNVAKGLMESGHPRSKAIEMAIGVVRNWAEGKGDVHPEVRAAAAKAIAEWEALKAAAHGGGGKRSKRSEEHTMRWTDPLDLKVVRTAAGSKKYKKPIGSQIGPARNAEAAKAQTNTKARADYSAMVGGKKADQAKQVTALNDADLQNLSRITYSFKSNDPQVVQLRLAIAAELKKRGMNVNNYGGLGPDKKQTHALTASSRWVVDLSTPPNLRAKARQQAADKGTALPDGSYPIRNLDELGKAIQAWGRCKPEDRQKVKNWILKRARALNAPDDLMQRARNLGTGGNS